MELNLKRPLAFFDLESTGLNVAQPVNNKKNIDTNSEYTTLEGETIQINGARDIANYAITSPAAHRTFITALFNHAIKQPTAAYGTDTLEKLLAHFQGNNFHIRDLLIEIATLTSLAENQ